MTTTDFAALAEQGVDAWNRWRAEHPDCAPDLSRAYLYGQVLSGFDLSNTDLSHACLIGADLQQANLSGACLESAYANSANFTET
ncbi:MAG: pentapeptide repeat-containing protein, partial [Cyanobacteria bacterium J06555_13]